VIAPRRFSSPKRSDKCPCRTLPPGRRVFTKHQRGAMLTHQLSPDDRKPVNHTLAGHHRFERAPAGTFDGEIPLAAHDRCRQSGNPSESAPIPGAQSKKRATSSMGFWVADRPIRTSGPCKPTPPAAQSDTAQNCRTALSQPRHRMDLIDDHRARGGQGMLRPDSEPSMMYSDLPASSPRYAADCAVRPARASCLRRIAGAPTKVSNGKLPANPMQAILSRMPASGAFEITIDIVRQAPSKRRHIHDSGFHPRAGLRDSRVPTHRSAAKKKRGKCLARNRWAQRSIHAGPP